MSDRVLGFIREDPGRALLDYLAMSDEAVRLEAVRRYSAATASSFAKEGLSLIIARGSTPPPFSKLDLYEADIARIRREAALAPDAGIREVAAAYLAKRPDVEAAGQKRLRALAGTGWADWYGWSIANWGTKWGAYRYAEVSAEPFVFRFETAWSFPAPIFERLAAMFPALAFECVCYDEGSNFAGDGWFNPPEGCARFTICDATNELYERAHGRPRPDDEDEDEEEPSFGAHG